MKEQHRRLPGEGAAGGGAGQAMPRRMWTPLLSPLTALSSVRVCSQLVCPVRLPSPPTPAPLGQGDAGKQEAVAGWSPSLAVAGRSPGLAVAGRSPSLAAGRRALRLVRPAPQRLPPLPARLSRLRSEARGPGRITVLLPPPPLLLLLLLLSVASRMMMRCWRTCVRFTCMWTKGCGSWG